MLEKLLLDLDEARRRTGMSKTELANLAGTHPAAVRRLLTSDGPNPTLATVAAVAEAIDYEIRLVPIERPVKRAGVKNEKKKANAEKTEKKAQAGGEPADDLLALGQSRFSTVLADPPWRFLNRTGKVAPEHRRLSRYDTMSTREIADLPVGTVVKDCAHLYLWVPNALLGDGLAVMSAWGFEYKSNIVWAKRRKDGGPDGRGVGFYFRNVTELLLFGVKGKMRTLGPGRRQVNMIETRKREHSRKPDEQYAVIEECSPGPYLEMFARYARPGWTSWGNEADETVVPKGKKHPSYR